MTSLKLGILISGRGSNMKALIDLCASSAVPTEIALVVSNRADAAGLETAQTAGIETDVIDHKAFDGRKAFDQALSARLKQADVELVCLAGFMRVLTDAFIDSWPDRIINIHPSLLPAFRGLNVHRQALEAGVKLSGCTVHLVTNELDGGPIIAQAAVPVLPADTEETLAARILEQEHVLYPRVVAGIATGAIRLDGGKVEFPDFKATPEQVLVSLPPQGEAG